MTRSILVLMAFVVLSLLPNAGMPTAHAQSKPRCETPEAPGDRREVTCSISVAAVPLSLRFKANFSGSHDDTMASMTATVDGEALTCNTGSKTELMGEDGDVSLFCDFKILAKASKPKVLKVVLSWRHAQYEGFELEAR